MYCGCVTRFEWPQAGESFIARMDGYNPAASATTMEKPTAPNARYAGMMLRRPELARERIQEKLDKKAQSDTERPAEEAEYTPTPRGNNPAILSMRQPSTLMMPISFVRSNMLIIIVFMMPDGGHQQCDAADCAEQVLRVLRARFRPFQPRPPNCMFRNPYRRWCSLRT